MEHYSLRHLQKRFKKTLYIGDIPIYVIRQNYEDFFYSPHIPNNADIQSVEINSIPVDIVKPEIAVADRVILYAHGGAFISGSRKTSRNLCVSLAHECSTHLFLPEYRLAPEYPFPAGLDDMFVCYVALCTVYGFKPHNIIFGGDGAGAALVASLVLKLKEQKKPLPAALVLLSPWLDMTCTHAEIAALKKKDAFLQKESLINSARRYAPSGQLVNPLVSPVYGDLADFPPVFIQCGSRELLCSDACRFAEKVTAAGGQVVLDIWDDMWHLFQAMEAYSQQAHKAVEKIGHWVQSRFVNE